MDLTITTFENRRNPNGKVLKTTWDSLVNRLRDFEITEDTLAEYASMSNEERTNCKDVGGYIGGECEGGKRSKATVLNRCLLTIDVDEANIEDVTSYSNPALCFVHTTHSSTDEQLRLRWVFPLSRPVTVGEYKLLVGVVNEWVGGAGIDETTDQPERLMFWPSVCLDDVLAFGQEMGSVPINPDELLDGIEIPEEVVVKERPEPSGSDEFIIEEGHRNRTVFGFAATLRGAGLSRADIRSMLDTYNENHCDPPLPSAELDTITWSVCSRYEPGASVHATLRDAWDDFNDLGEWDDTKKRREDSNVIERISASELDSRQLTPPKYVVDNLIAPGITILASPPKYGKSWMCHALCQDVARGDDFLGMKTGQCGVLYLALEDGEYRLQDRGRKVSNGKPLPASLYLSRKAPSLAEGLLPALQECLNSIEEKLGLIVIDTLQKVRGEARKNEGVYGYDYRELGQLHEFALDNDIAIVLVHHLRKGDSDSDFIERLNGSTGVSGAADSVIVLSRSSRGSDETKMNITGRDVTERTLVLQMNWGTYRWICLGDERDVAKDKEDVDFHADPIVKTVIYHLDDAEESIGEDAFEVTWQVSIKDFADAVFQQSGSEGMSSVAIGRRLASVIPLLEQKESITVEPWRDMKHRGYIFRRPIL